MPMPPQALNFSFWNNIYRLAITKCPNIIFGLIVPKRRFRCFRRSDSKQTRMKKLKNQINRFFSSDNNLYPIYAYIQCGVFYADYEVC